MIRKKETRENKNEQMLTKHITEPNEGTKSQIIRHDLDYNPDLEKFLIYEEINKILAMTIFICSIVFLLNTWGW